MKMLNIENMFLRERDLSSLPEIPREFIIEGLIMIPSITWIVGEKGAGKSYFTWEIIAGATKGKRVGPWYAGYRANTLVIDGELPIEDIRERYNTMCRCLSSDGKYGELHLCLDAHMNERGEDPLNIMDPTHQKAINEYVAANDITLVVFDNLATLCGDVDENEGSEFYPLKTWFKQLRYKGVSLIVVHHTGKRIREQRGTSSHEDINNLSLLIKKAGNSVKDGCHFKVEVKNDRARLFTNPEEIELVLITHPECDHRYLEEKKYITMNKFGEWDYISEKQESPPKNNAMQKGNSEETKCQKALEIISANPNLTLDEAERLGIKKRTFYRAKMAFLRKGAA